MIAKQRSVSILLILVAIVSVTFCGCRSGGVNGGGDDAIPTVPKAELEKYEEYISGYDLMGLDEREAAWYAIQFAKDSNIGLFFKATSLVLAEGWARVYVEQAETPADLSVAFDVFLKKLEDGTWEVERSGTGVTSEDLPSAPEKIFR